jgi:hypothetical protein
MMHQADIERVFKAGLTTRWHTNPWLAQTCDRLDGHQGRVARLILALWPDAGRALIIAALTHDDGESVTGDIPATRGKSHDHETAEQAARIMVWNGRPPMLSSKDAARLHFADRLDAAMWMLHHNPLSQDIGEWQDALSWIGAEAERLGVEDRL